MEKILRALEKRFRHLAIPNIGLLIVLPKLISLDTGCIWGRQLTAVRLDKSVLRVYQVPGQDR